MNDNARQREAVMRGQYSSSDAARLQALHQKAYEAPALAKAFVLPPQLSQQQAAWLPDGYKLSNATRRTSITDRQSDSPRQYDIHGVEMPPNRPSNGRMNGKVGDTVKGKMNGKINGTMNGSMHGIMSGNMNGTMRRNIHGKMNGNGNSSPHNSPALPNAMLLSGDPRTLSRGANTSGIHGNMDGRMSGDMNGSIRGNKIGTTHGNENGNSSPHSSPALPNAMISNGDPRTLSRGANTSSGRQHTTREFHNSQTTRQDSNGRPFYGIRQVPNMVPVEGNRPRAPPAVMVVPPSTNGAQQLSGPPSMNGVQPPSRLPSASGQRQI